LNYISYSFLLKLKVFTGYRGWLAVSGFDGFSQYTGKKEEPKIIFHQKNI